MLTSFGQSSLEWWSIFQRVTTPEKADTHTGQIQSWRIDFVQALAAFDLYGVKDKVYGIEVLDHIERCLRSDHDLTDEFVLYGEGEPMGESPDVET